jgi:hypothetical protein
MKIFSKIILNIFLTLAFLISLIYSTGVLGPKINAILSILILAILIVYNVKVSVKFSHRSKTIVVVALLLGCLAYLAIPKKDASCAGVANGLGCSSQYCVGLPTRSFNDPICFGYAFGEKNWFEFEK